MEVAGAVRIGTRGSRLALRQTELVADRLRQAVPGLTVDVQVITTQGDRVQDRAISDIGDKAVFVRAIEAHLLEGTVDLAVHSLKDVPSYDEVPGLILAAFSVREDPRDVLISSHDRCLNDLPACARVGTSSPRRRAQLLAVRSDVAVCDIRGNVDTRLARLREGRYEALILAAAGLSRLGLSDRVTQYFPADEWLPDAGQGIIAVQARAGDRAADLARAVDCPESRLAALAERAVVRALNADCYSPVGAYARLDADMIVVDAVTAGAEPGALYREHGRGPAAEAERVGKAVGARLAERMGRNSRLY